MHALAGRGYIACDAPGGGHVCKIKNMETLGLQFKVNIPIQHEIQFSRTQCSCSRIQRNSAPFS